MPPDIVKCLTVAKIAPRWESLTYINGSLCTCLRSDWCVMKRTDAWHMPIVRDYLAHRITLSKRDFSYLGKLNKVSKYTRYLAFVHPVPHSTLLCGREGWPNRLHQGAPSSQFQWSLANGEHCLDQEGNEHRLCLWLSPWGVNVRAGGIHPLAIRRPSSPNSVFGG